MTVNKFRREINIIHYALCVRSILSKRIMYYRLKQAVSLKIFSGRYVKLAGIIYHDSIASSKRFSKNGLVILLPNFARYHIFNLISNYYFGFFCLFLHFFLTRATRRLEKIGDIRYRGREIRYEL